MFFALNMERNIPQKYLKKQLNMVVVEELELEEGDDEEFFICNIEKGGTDDRGGSELPEEELELSINAITGDFNHSTIRIKERVKKRQVSVLIDPGSSSSFIDSKLVVEYTYKRPQQDQQ